MIAYLSGRVLHLAPGTVVLEAGGVGYEVHLPLSALAKLHGRESAALFIHTHLRQDQLTLFGFPTAAERDVFRLLLGVAGVGPRMALALLSSLTPEELTVAVEGGQWQLLAQAPGVGRRTAERVVVELKGKLAKLVQPPVTPIRDDAVSALVNLGYPSKQAADVVSALLREKGDWELAELLREALRRLVKDKALG
ncbi:MAG: Holliday junction branch migration protein RuvA [Thermoanaerobaculum sp.]